MIRYDLVAPIRGDFAGDSDNNTRENEIPGPTKVFWGYSQLTPRANFSGRPNRDISLARAGDVAVLVGPATNHMPHGPLHVDPNRSGRT